MKHYKTEKVPATTREVLDHTTCDICARTTREGDLPFGQDWAPAEFDVDAVTVERHFGTNYPSGPNLKVTTFDICGNCFEEKLLPWLKEQGATPRTYEVD